MHYQKKNTKYEWISNMKITQQQLKQLIKEEMEGLPEADRFSDHSSLTISIRDAIIGHIESEKFFEMGAIPQSVLKIIENSSLRIAAAVEGNGVSTSGNGQLDSDELRTTNDIDDMGPSTSQMPASWQQILGNTLDGNDQ
jgi:hypothetical protein